ncbi:bifunctional glycosyltransferase/class I SAM-dependent methyltransferase [Myxococcota bacterium]|nr:bifunctional glycosyltransferase/class I SAM-dependent methyltransferase [Myxococcota bacterium]
MAERLTVIMPVYNERHLVAEAIRRVLAVRSPHIEELMLVVVDDGSTDGTREILRKLAAADPAPFVLIEHEINQGKGAAIRTGIAEARGTVTVIQDADLEYNPQDLGKIMVPFVAHEADAVFGSRFLASDYRRVLYMRHSLGNKLLTFLASVITDLNLSDMETCYKAVRTELLRSIPIRSHDFRLEPELTIKLAKRGARVFEVPISYAGRTYQEGKKIGARDGFLAIFAMLHWWLVDDIYQKDEYGSNILVDLSGVPRFNRWMAQVLHPSLGSRVLEVGAGIGNLSRQFIPRERYTVSDVNPHYLSYLRNFAENKPYMEVRRVDLASDEDFVELAGGYDTALCVNVLEHLEDEAAGLRNLAGVLDAGGKLVLLVPQGPGLYGTLDEALGHQQRYTRESLRSSLEMAGFDEIEIQDFNRCTVPAWWINGKVLRRRHFSRVQLKFVNHMTWLFRLLEPLLPWRGASLVAVAIKRPS